MVAKNPKLVTPEGVTLPLGSIPAELAERDVKLTENSRIVMSKRYVRRDSAGDPAETLHETFWRVASNVAEAEVPHDSDALGWAEVFYDMLRELRFLPNSPTFTGAGTPLGNLSACFVLPISDDMGKESDGIFMTLRNAALIQQTGGGNGFSFSRLRSKGTRVKSSNGQASGPIGFLQAYDQSFGIVNQGGARRGANMGVLRIDHPDVREFITCKTSELAITNFNISVAITDEFMKAVAEDGDFDLVEPSNGQVVETVKARELFDAIAEHAHHNGEPGVLFIDAANRSNPIPHVGTYEATNPCVTGDTRIYTDKGLVKAEDLFNDETEIAVAIDGRFGHEVATTPATRVFYTGNKPVYRLQTKEGYSLRATADHRIMTARGWVELGDLQAGDKIHIQNRKGGFGQRGSLEEGHILGGQVALAEQELAVAAVGQAVTATQAATTTSYGLAEKKHQVPEVVFQGAEEMQRGFLQALFTADGSFQDGGPKGASVRLAANELELLESVQMLLSNFGIASRIYRERRAAGMRMLPNGQGGLSEYFCEAQHELAITKRNLNVFAEEIGFMMAYKQEALNDYLTRGSRGTYRENFTARVESITLEGEEAVYDLTEPLTHSFVGNGIVVHNCGEQWLLPYESCNLGSVNLSLHVTEDGKVDWDKLQATIEQATRFLDDVVEVNRYVDAVPQLREAALRARRIGLGFMGLADMMIRCNLRYGSVEGQEFAAQISEFMRYHAMKTSIALAKERGAFPAIKGSIYDPENVTWKPPQPLTPYQNDWGRPKLNWKSIVKSIKKHGIRNAAQTTIAPTGTISTVSGCEGYGCEPVFALAYTRYVVDGESRFELTYGSPLLEEKLRGAGLDDEAVQQIINQVSEEGGCQTVEAIPEDIRNALVVSSDVTPEEHVRMQANIQAFIDNSISKTINMPNSATVEDVQTAYRLAWELGAKGLTVYVTGSRDVVVLETKATREAREGKGDAPQATATEMPDYGRKKPRPMMLTGRTYRLPTPAGTAYVTINENGHGPGQPFEVFINTSKAGSEIAAISEAIGRLISLILRQASPVEPRERVQEVVRQLSDIGGGRQMGFGPNRVVSLPDAIARVLRDYLDETADLVENAVLTEEGLVELHPTTNGNGNGHYVAAPASNGVATKNQIGDICPECGAATLIRKEGCVSCHNCGYSEC